jgi:hypothetical protein
MNIDTNLFHILWSKAVGTVDYTKSEWLELDNQIANANRFLKAEEKKETEKLLASLR